MSVPYQHPIRPDVPHVSHVIHHFRRHIIATTPTRQHRIKIGVPHVSRVNISTMLATRSAIMVYSVLDWIFHLFNEIFLFSNKLFLENVFGQFSSQFWAILMQEDLFLAKSIIPNTTANSVFWDLDVKFVWSLWELSNWCVSEISSICHCLWWSLEKF